MSGTNLPRDSPWGDDPPVGSESERTRYDPIDFCIHESREYGVDWNATELREEYKAMTVAALDPTPYAGMYSKPLLDSGIIKSRLGRYIRLTEDPALFEAHIIWQPLPARSNNVIAEHLSGNCGESNCPVGLYKEMLGVAKRYDSASEVNLDRWLETPFLWFVQLPNCDCVLLSEKLLGNLLRLELDRRRPPPVDVFEVEITDNAHFQKSKFPVLPPIRDCKMAKTKDEASAIVESGATKPKKRGRKTDPETEPPVKRARGEELLERRAYVAKIDPETRAINLKPAENDVAMPDTNEETAGAESNGGSEMNMEDVLLGAPQGEQVWGAPRESNRSNYKQDT